MDLISILFVIVVILLVFAVVSAVCDLISYFRKRNQKTG